MPVFNAVLTNQAEDAALDYENTQITLQITHVGFGTSPAIADLNQLSVLGEVGRVAVAGGGIEPNSRTMTANVIWTPDQVRDIGQIGFYAGDTLFCIYAPGAAIVRVTPDVGIAASFSVSLVRLPNGSVNIVVNDSLSPMMLLLGQHLTNPNPHPQYAMKAAFDSHVLQNGLEHGNILTLLNNLVNRFQGMLEFQYAVGCFYWTDQVGNPNTWLQPIIGYETFWRPIVGRSLMSIDPADSRIGAVGSVFGTMVTTLGIENLPPHDHADGEFNKLLRVTGGQTTDATDNTGGEPNLGSAGTLQSVGESVPFNNVHPVYLSYCWQRYDPSGFRTVNITENMFDVNLLDLYTSIYGTPTAGTFRFVVTAGTVVTGSSTSNYAVVTGSWPVGAQPVLEVFGIVAGRGGRGGLSAAFRYPRADSTEIQIENWDLPTAGENGGNAILATTTPLEVINHNIVAGGGAGGGGMGAWVADTVSLPGGTFGDGIGASGGAGGGAPFGARAPNQNTYEAYLLDPLFPVKGDRTLYPDAGFFSATVDGANVWNKAGSIISNSFGSNSPSSNIVGSYIFPQYTDSSQIFYKVESYGDISMPIRMSQNGTATQGGLGGYGSPDNYFVSFANESLSVDLSLNYGGRGGDIGQNGQAGVMQAFYKDDGSTRTQSQLALYIPPAAGGLAGIAITGPVTVTGNPVLGR